MDKMFKPWPILRGKDAARFLKKMKENENKTISKAEYEKMMEGWRKLNAIFKHT